MGAAEKLAQHASELTFRSRNDRQHQVIINYREISYLRRGLSQPGGKLPLFDLDGQEFEASVIRRCIDSGWAEPWFSNPLNPEWLVCKLTPSGRATIEQALDQQTSTVPSRRMTLID